MTAVITTINKPTKAIEKLYDHFGENIIIVGDKKTPSYWNYKGIKPLFESDKLYAPVNHYARKNIGYMAAIKNNSDLIYDTDDDNIPNEKWKVRSVNADGSSSITKGWYNVYRLLSELYIWPRGFSLRHLKNFPSSGKQVNKQSSIQQGLSDADPDVDAIWRLVIGKENKFTINKSIFLNEMSWCPFNSQSTWWFPKAYPLMYLPVYCSFRMTDIWRSFVAQRCLWEIGDGVTFHSPSEVLQVRNDHDLIKDFEDEVPGYLNNDLIVQILSGLTLNGTVCGNMLTCYDALIDAGILPEDELKSLTKWVVDYEYATGNIQ